MKWASTSFATAFAIRVLPVPGRAVEQYPLGRLDPEALEDLRVSERELDHLAHELQFAAETTDILVMDIGHFGFALFGFVGLFLQLDLGVVGDDDHALGGHLRNDKRDGVAYHVDADRLSFDNRPPAQYA